MPPLRPPLFPRYRGYVCPSCTAKIQAHRVPPWLVRTATNQASMPMKKAKSSQRQPEADHYPHGGNIAFNPFDEGSDGAWKQGFSDEDIAAMDVDTMRSKVADLEAEFEEDGVPPFFEIDQEIASEDTKPLDRSPGKRRNINGTGEEDPQGLMTDSTTSQVAERKNRGRDSTRAAPGVSKNVPEAFFGKIRGDEGGGVQKRREIIGNMRHNINVEEDLATAVSRTTDLPKPAEEYQGLSAEDMKAAMPLKSIRTKDGQQLDVEGLRSAISATSASPQMTTIPIRAFPDERQVNILRLNVALERSLKNVSHDTTHKELWKWYSLSRKGLALHWSLVPYDVWKTLWDVFAKESPNNPDRMPHIRKLGEDMLAAGVKLDGNQIMLYLEALFLDGNHEGALSEWESRRAALIFDSSTASDYWALGARMLANDNRPDEAQQAADILLNDSEGTKDVRVLLPIIRAWLLSSDSAAVQKAWALYVRFKFLLGNEATMEDYDAVTGVFLDAQQTDLALAVFRDMMMSRETSAYHHDSVALYKRSMRTIGDLHSINFWPGETSWQSHDAFTTILPKQRNKFFFGSWIKKLIGDGRVDSAAQVMDLMCRRGIPPDPRHVNGIIGAWLRSGMAESQRKAEDLAWRMIADRMSFVKARAQKRDFDGPVRATYNLSRAGSKGFPDSRIAVLATSETFSILVEYYQQRQKHDRVQELYQMIGAAQISPSTAFLNDMLLIGVRDHKKQWAWTMYHGMIKHGVKPDHDTFALLWQLMKAHVDPVKNRTRAGFPSCRSLFAEMVKWEPIIKSEDMSRALYEHIILCFGLADDQIGTAVTLRAMQQLYNIYPDQNTVRSIALQLAKVGVKGSGAPSRRLNLNSETKKKIAKIAKILSNLKDERLKALADRGIRLDDMDEKQKSEESILLLCDVLRFTVQTRNKRHIEASWEEATGETSSVERMGQTAAQEMGVPQCAPWGAA